ncbi:hypothetical protein FYZ41_04250 [Mobiluncus mulieris]|nr:hypothetical protein [Mobiluncus mulieris]MCV0011397.1 hypothetical protein [Mobiluncus mulieris]PNL42803.1 hypothetical protein CEP82_002685 [Mobiluncus mulieris]
MLRRLRALVPWCARAPSLATPSKTATQATKQRLCGGGQRPPPHSVEPGYFPCFDSAWRCGRIDDAAPRESSGFQGLYSRVSGCETKIQIFRLMMRKGGAGRKPGTTVFSHITPH